MKKLFILALSLFCMQVYAKGNMHLQDVSNKSSFKDEKYLKDSNLNSIFYALDNYNASGYTAGGGRALLDYQKYLLEIKVPEIKTGYCNPINDDHRAITYDVTVEMHGLLKKNSTVPPTSFLVDRLVFYKPCKPETLAPFNYKLMASDMKQSIEIYKRKPEYVKDLYIRPELNGYLDVFLYFKRLANGKSEKLNSYCLKKVINNKNDVEEIIPFIINEVLNTDWGDEYKQKNTPITDAFEPAFRKYFKCN